jgi:hypothetical protein
MGVALPNKAERATASRATWACFMIGVLVENCLAHDIHITGSQVELIWESVESNSGYLFVEGILRINLTHYRYLSSAYSN